MARALQIEFAGVVYHITARGNGRQDTFVDDQDRELFLRVLPKIAPRFQLISGSNQWGQIWVQPMGSDLES